jgi:TPP-dependent pyruvate/acetoin dehydrogenase alpha subunit
MSDQFPPRLGKLADPLAYVAPLDIAGEDPAMLAGQLEDMLVIRTVEERIGDMVTAGKIVCPCHLGIGQEAIAVGVAAGVRKTDRIFGTHRSHSHYLALGGDVYGLLAEVLGKADGCSRGMGGSMHLHDARNGFMGSVPIVAGTVPLAVGAALAAKMDRRGDVAVVYFGDGATEEGAIHESLNLASVFKLPVLFVCENNFFSSHLQISQRQPENSTARFAAAHAVKYDILDGNDVIAVARAAGRLISRAREGGGPGYLEAVTYRWRGHVGPREDVDVGVNRSGDLASWKKRDPIRRLAEALQAGGHLGGQDLERMRHEVTQAVDNAWCRAEQAPFPPASALLGAVYA